MVPRVANLNVAAHRRRLSLTERLDAHVPDAARAAIAPNIPASEAVPAAATAPACVPSACSEKVGTKGTMVAIGESGTRMAAPAAERDM